MFIAGCVQPFGAKEVFYSWRSAPLSTWTRRNPCWDVPIHVHLCVIWEENVEKGAQVGRRESMEVVFR